MDQTFKLVNDFLQGLFAYGPIWIYLALGAASFVENIFPPFPGDVFTLAGGALAASGWLNIFLVFLMVYLGGVTSCMLVYYLGYAYGREFFIRKNYKLISAQDIIKLQGWFNRKGAPLLILNRFIIGGRSAIALISGISKYSAIKTGIFLSISFWLFNGLLLFGSYLFVINFETIAYRYHLYEKIVWTIITVIIVIFVVVKIYRVKKNAKQT